MRLRLRLPVLVCGCCAQCRYSIGPFQSNNFFKNNIKLGELLCRAVCYYLSKDKNGTSSTNSVNTVYRVQDIISIGANNVIKIFTEKSKRKLTVSYDK